MKTTLLTLLLGLLTIGGLQAQKFGHINSQEIIAAFPEVKAADSELESYSNQLIQKGQAMMKDYQTKVQAYQTKVNNGELSQLQMQTEETALLKLQDDIKKYEIEVQGNIAQKKQAIYQPLLDKINVAIQAVGKENGYTMIFDSSSFGMVYTKETEDVMPLVKAKLGM